MPRQPAAAWRLTVPSWPWALRGFAGDVHRSRCRPAVHGSVVYGRHHDDGRAGPDAEASGSSMAMAAVGQARQHAHQRSGNAADQGEKSL